MPTKHDLSSLRLYHGTKADLKAWDLMQDGLEELKRLSVEPIDD